MTQNVDDLHERAGATDVIHMHGELLRARCTHCATVTRITTDLTTSSTCTDCSSTGTLRPHIVWFGEIPFHMDEISAALESCDRFVAIGTSGLVYPAAGFVQQARASGSNSLEINISDTETSSFFEAHLIGPAEETVPRWVDSILAAKRD